ncbi:MAG TPA: DUF4230 domain-containing protein [Polyangiaceae bacterium]
MHPDPPKAAELSVTSTQPPRRARRIEVVSGVAAFALLATGAYVVGRLSATPVSLLPPPSHVTVEVVPSPNVLTAVRDLRRLEAAQYHFERLVDLSRKESHLYGAVVAKDRVLLVASGDVTAGVDLGELRETDVTVDWAMRKATVLLPPAKIFASDLDESHTHVYDRQTDLFAHRDEALEGDARKVAEDEMKTAAKDAGMLDRAGANARDTVKNLLRSLGFTTVDVRSRPVDS